MKKTVAIGITVCVVAVLAMVALYASFSRMRTRMDKERRRATELPGRLTDTRHAPAEHIAAATPDRSIQPPSEPPGGPPPGIPGHAAALPPKPPGAVPNETGDGRTMGEELPPGASATPRERPTAPPDMDRPEPPPSMPAQINSFLEESQRSAGPEAVRLGEQLLASTNPVLRVAGLAVLSENDALTADMLRQIAEDEDLAVPINSLGWLRDTGNGNMADSLAALLNVHSFSSDNLIDLIDSGSVDSSGSRAALELLSGDLTAEEARDLFSSIGEDETHEYSVRMKATLLLRESLDFESFRSEVNQLQNQATSEDALWQEGITRLATRLQGPAQVHEGTATLRASDVDELLAREYPMSLEDLAQHLESIVGQEDAYVEQGTADRLNERIEQLKKQPWTEDQQVSLTRIEAIAAQLSALEQAESEAPANATEPPPGAGE